jgi:hypothetical protein
MIIDHTSLLETSVMISQKLKISANQTRTKVNQRKRFLKSRPTSVSLAEQQNQILCVVLLIDLRYFLSAGKLLVWM